MFEELDFEKSEDIKRVSKIDPAFLMEFRKDIFDTLKVAKGPLLHNMVEIVHYCIEELVKVHVFTENDVRVILRGAMRHLHSKILISP